MHHQNRYIQSYWNLLRYGYNNDGWSIKPNACYTKSCKKNYAKWYSFLESGLIGINKRLADVNLLSTIEYRGV
ncbi:MAG: hypothetical protein P8J69_02560 [Flavobacteriaceae bacterium]|nr:hypothetical protein [Flavobacteriaceae bacterium]